MAEESLGQRAGRAALWQVAGGGWQTIVRLGASVYLARALKPSDFGLFGMALLYQQLLVTALSLGFGTGLIVKKDLTEEDLSTSFWLSCAVRITVFLAVFLTAPLAAMFWKEPRVEPVIRVISFVLLINLFIIIPETLARKNLEFKKINIIRGLAILLESSTAVALVALTHLTYWALVIGMMVNAVFYNLTLWLTTGAWRPKLTFHKDAFRYLFRFGFYSWLFFLVNYLKQNIDYFLVGRLLGTYKLGLYEFAYRLPHLVYDRISQPVGDVVFPALSRVQEEDETFLKGYIAAIKYVCFLCYPILFAMIALSDTLVPILWGKKWISIVDPMRILCLVVIIRCLVQPIYAFFSCKNRPDLGFKVVLLEFLFLVSLLFIFIRKWHIIGVSLAILLSVIFLLLTIILVVYHSMRINLIYLYFEIGPILLVNLILMLFLWLFKNFLLKIKFSCIGVLFLLSFFVCLYPVLFYFLFPDYLKSMLCRFKKLIFR